MRLGGRITLYVAAIAGILVVAAGWFALRVLAAAAPPAISTIRVPQAWRSARESPGHLAHVDDAKVACRACHDLSKALEPPPAGTCEGCHADVTTPMHASPLASAVDCTGCHDFLGTRADSASPWSCLGCHREPQGFAARAVRPHGDAPCGSCHRPHQSPALVPRDCGECHAEKETRHGGDASTMATSCTTCHSPHDMSADVASRCLGCHATGKPAITERALVGHETCTTCHAGHDFDKKGVDRCKGCHDKQVTLASNTASGHQRCQSCHAPHDPSHPKACASCHPTVHPDHPASAGGCLGCHPIHPKSDSSGALARASFPASKAVACATCHSREDGHAAKQPCTGCHTPHQVVRSQKSLACASCHGGPAKTVAGTGHATCTTCHTKAAHAPELAPATCATCHARQVTQTARVDHGGHAKCEGCHTGGAHAPTARAACGDCHEVEAKTAPKGHAQCASCHAPHDGARAKTCVDCHKDRTRGHGDPARLGKGALAGGCQSCHRPHGPDALGVASPPACARCHERARLPGLHANAKHATCTDCHDAHAPAPRADRATCTKCHTDRRDHEPTAKVCNGCHVFGRSPG